MHKKLRRDTGCIVVLYLLLLVPIFCAMGMAADLRYSVWKSVAFLCVVVIGLMIPAFFFKGRTYFLIVGVLNVFFAPLDIASLYLNRQSASKLFLNSVFSTNWDEAVELLSSLWPLCIGVVGYWFVYFVLAFRVRNVYIFPKLVRRITLVSLPVLAVVSLGGMTWLMHRLHSEKSVKECVTDAADSVLMKFYKIFPYNIYLGCRDLWSEQRQWRQAQERLADFSFGIREREDLGAELFVLVIGESSRYDHWGINGYARSTTPRLAQCTNFVSYDSVYSQANLTNYSVPLLLTRATAANAALASEEKSLPEAFAEAGYATAFVSKNTFSPFTERIMKSCDYGYIYPKGIDVADNYDGELVWKARDIVEPSAQMMVLHSLGSHYKYSLRYPSSPFTVFAPVFEASYGYSMIAPEYKDLLVNAYDNSIVYTDFVLASLIQWADSLNRPAVVLYIADHGESFWDDERGLSLHGSYAVSQAEYHVPMLVWYSEEYAMSHADKVAAMRRNRSVPVSSQVVFYSLLDMAGLSEAVDSTHSICSPALQAQPVVPMLNGEGKVQEVAVRLLR